MTAESTRSAGVRQELERLNGEYIDAFLAADVEWYRERLPDDFVCIEADGAVLDKVLFLQQAARGPDVVDYTLQEMDVRLYGEVVLVRATGLFSRADGSIGLSRYVDVYARFDDAWKTVSAQITRTSAQ